MANIEGLGSRRRGIHVLFCQSLTGSDFSS